VAPASAYSGAEAHVTRDDRGAAAPTLTAPFISPTRINDSPSYWGGARWGPLTAWSAGIHCTTGFAIARGDQEAMLTAAHCAANGDYAYDGGFGNDDQMGRIQNSQLPGTKKGGHWLGMDVEEIKTSVAPRMYHGGIGASASDSVVGAQNNYEGNIVCTNGASSGTRCNIVVEDTGLTTIVKPHTDGKPMYSSHMVRAVHLYGGNAGGNTDSGGPVFAFVKNFPTRAWARGIYSALGFDNVPCTGVPESSIRVCSDEVWYVDLNWALSASGAQLQTTWP
jgi:hypothetical protein